MRQNELCKDICNHVSYTGCRFFPFTMVTRKKNFNEQALKESQKNLYESQSVTSLLINHPKLLLRKKQEVWPNGRTSYRFKNALRKRVTIIGKSMFGNSHLIE